MLGLVLVSGLELVEAATLTVSIRCFSSGFVINCDTDSRQRNFPDVEHSQRHLLPSHRIPRMSPRAPVLLTHFHLTKTASTGLNKHVATSFSPGMVCCQQTHGNRLLQTICFTHSSRISTTSTAPSTSSCTSAVVTSSVKRPRKQLLAAGIEVAHVPVDRRL